MIPINREKLRELIKELNLKNLKKDINNDIYGIELSDSMISRITDKILPLITEWQNRPLAPMK